MLSPIEVVLINSLDEGIVYSLDSAADRCGLSRDAVLKAAYMLQEKGFAEVLIEKKRIFSLTGEGKLYLEKGTPEEQLYNLVKKEGSISVERAREIIGRDKVNIAIGWLRKRGIISIENGLIKIKKSASFSERDYLKLIQEGKAVLIPENNLKELLNRKLVDFDEEKEISIKIVKKPAADSKEVLRDITPELLLSGGWRGKEFLKYDVKIPSKTIYTSKIHPYERIIRECRKIFLEMGFTEIKGNYVQSSFWNFDALFQPQDHPARDMQDTFYLQKFTDLEEEFVEKVKQTHLTGWKTGSTGWGGSWSIDTAKRLVLRTHTTAITIHYLARNPEPPVKAFTIDRVYRREAIDATHLPEFEQLEGVVLDKNVGFRHLLGLLKEFFLKMGFEDVRFRPGYFPYTEPSVEPEVYVDGMGWIELGGAGVFRKEVTEPLGIKGKVLAWGLGMGRLAMLRLGMKDLRRLYQPDISWLRELPAIIK